SGSIQGSHETMRTFIARRICVATVAAALAVVGLSAPANADSTTGSISGQFVDSHGQPIAFADVEIWTPGQQSWAGSTSTDDQGHYPVSGLASGDYTLQFNWNGLSGWGHRHQYAYDADPVPVTAGADVTFDEQASPTGVITGVLSNS